jgi:acyl CoA:acetate/3-ketoacid CoA transferase alpha subunit/acyl CoA:acetate/3-ketoacid CoA transferase beta subunit
VSPGPSSGPAPGPAPGPARSGLVVPLAEAIRTHVAPGMHLHLASTPSRSNAAIRELARAFLDTRPEFCLSSTGFHSMAHLLPRLGLARRLIGCFFGDHYPAPRPSPLYSRGDLELVHWPLWSLVASLRAGAQGERWVVNRSLRGTTMAAELAARGLYREVELAGEPEPLGLCAALRPDITFVHAAAADDEGHVLMAGPLSEGPWAALAARRGVIVTVERVVPAAVTRAHRAAIVLPPHRVLAVCEEPFGAHPQPLLVPDGLDLAPYRDDFEHYERWRALATDDAALAQFVARVLRAADGGAAYRDEVGAAQLARLRAPPGMPPGMSSSEPASPASSRAARAARAVRAARATAAPERAQTPVDPLIVAGARQLAQRARAIGAQVLIAGIGQAFFAARLAQLQLAAAGFRLRVMVETGLYDLDCGPDGHGYLLAYDNMTRARRVTAIDDILGVLVGGDDNRCLAALGAAQIDRRGNLNSTRLGGKWLVGSGGACDIAALAAEVVVMTRLAPGRLVDEVEYVTSPGHAVRSVVTDRGMLTRTGDRAGRGADPTWTLEALAVATGASTGAEAVAAGVAMIGRDCPWSIAPADGLGFAAPITDDEAHLLSTLDPTGKYRHRAG